MMFDNMFPGSSPKTPRVPTASLLALLPVLLPALAPNLATTTSLRAQTGGAGSTDADQVERLRRDQDEILRKAERLEKLMVRLQTRYEREGKQEQVEYLKAGIRHLREAGVLGDVASIREDLETTALTEALRKQREVVNELEKLLNILLARKSLESIDNEIDKVRDQAASAAQLEQRQRELIEATQKTLQSDMSQAEQELAAAFSELGQEEQREAERNLRQAGIRRPFLESALERVEKLLKQQDQLERGLADEAAGRTPETQQEAFDIGELTQQVRQLQRQLKQQQQQQQLGEAGRKLQAAAAAANEDPQALQQAKDEIARLLENAPPMPGGNGDMFDRRDDAWADLRERNRDADPDSEAGRQELNSVGKESDELGSKRDEQARSNNQQTTASARAAAEKLAQTMRQQAGEAAAPNGAAPQAADSPESAGQPENGKPEASGQPEATTSPEASGGSEPQTPQAGDPAAKDAAAAMADASKKLAEAEASMKQGETDSARRSVEQALAALDKARQKHREENPDATRQADQMAAEAKAAARELGNSPDPQDAEKSATAGLQQAAEALREVAEQTEGARDGGPSQSQANRPQNGQPQSPEQGAQQSRQSLEQARDALQEALSQEASESQQEMEAAQQRQQDLREQVQQAQQQLQQAAQNGDVSPKQQQAAKQQLDRAEQKMQQASSKLQQGQQAGAAQQQQEAADAMQQAAESLEQNREINQDQKDQLAQQAAAQEQLTEDIIRLAKELEERDNEAARQAVEEAADASRKAQRAMADGDAQEAQEQQDKAREKLQEAQEDLEEEEDRYQDLRQEELLFKMKEELTTFLDKQRPITEQTKRFQESANGGRLARSARSRVKGLGEEEQALAGRLEFLVQALDEDGNLVYQSVLRANLEDLREISRRLAGRRPDVGSFTTLLQDDVERRSEQLLEALEREMQRREKERQEEQQQQQEDQEKPKNRFNQQREQLVSLIADLEMLKQLGSDTGNATANLRTLVEARGDETISDAESAMIQRLHHRHNEITKLFTQIKAGVEEAMQAGQQGEEEEEGR